MFRAIIVKLLRFPLWTKVVILHFGVRLGWRDVAKQSIFFLFSLNNILSHSATHNRLEADFCLLQVYISCSVILCETGNPMSRCAQGCVTNLPKIYKGVLYKETALQRR